MSIHAGYNKSKDPNDKPQKQRINVYLIGDKVLYQEEKYVVKSIDERLYGWPMRYNIKQNKGNKLINVGYEELLSVDSKGNVRWDIMDNPFLPFESDIKCL
jgi:hypothetical protein